MFLVLACTSEPEPVAEVDLKDPAACAGCHPDQAAQWSGSMHAYAAVDPVYDAMVARGAREAGELDCEGCHRPTAQGVSCAFCHLDDQGVMHGGLEDPVDAQVHGSAWSAQHDREQADSVALCGSCHDRSYQEWRQSVFSYDNPDQMLTCGGCHMRGRDGVASTLEGSPERRVHDHSVPGVGVALIDFPRREEQTALVQQALAASVLPQLCVFPMPETRIEVLLENIASGHAWPSCSRNRRAWVEVVAYAEDGSVLMQSGVVDDDTPLVDVDDPQLWVLGERYVNNGVEVLFPWEAAEIQADTLLPMDLFGDSQHQRRDYIVPGGWVARATVRIRVRPERLDLLDALVESGDLDPAVRAAAPTWTVAYAELEWTPEGNVACVP